MDGSLYFGDLEVGQMWRSRGRTVTESDVVNFACMTGDFDPLHVDHEFAKRSPFGQPIAHGLLGMSLVAGLASNHPAVHTDAFISIQDWKFRKPLMIGDTVYVRNEVVEKLPSGRRRGIVRWKRQLVNQQDEVIQEGVFETIVRVESVTKRPQSSNIKPHVFEHAKPSAHLSANPPSTPSF